MTQNQPANWVDSGIASPGLEHPVAITKADRAYHLIRQDIIQGRLAAGMPLDQESIATQYGLSTTPIREALNRLESEGLVITRPHRRTVVAPMSIEAVAETYAVRLVLDPLAARLAAEHATEEQCELIMSLAKRPAEQDPVAALHGNRRLHRAIYAASGNDVLIRILDLLWDRSDRYRLMTLSDSTHLHTAHGEHVLIAEAIANRDGDRAHHLTLAHLAASLENFVPTEHAPEHEHEH